MSDSTPADLCRGRRPLRSLLASATLLVALLAASSPSVAALADADLSADLDGWLREVYPADGPGAAVIATRDGQVVFRGAYGMADLELGVSLEPDMVFRLGSITKQFTGAAILLLEQEGKLSLDDPITDYLPDYPTHGHEITIAHLVAHTSGIRSYTGMPGWMQTKIKQDLELEELIDGFKNEPMDFAPGERFLYNNSGYVLLGAVIEKASGMPYEEYVAKRIFEPLGMNSSYYGDHGRLIPRRARGYDGEPGNYRNAQYLSMTQPHAAGSLLSTVDDLAKWDAALYTEDLLDRAHLDKQVVPFTLADGESTRYAYGLFVDGTVRGRPAVSHGGGIFGFRTHAIRLPEERVYVAVLSNSTGHPTGPDLVARTIAARVIGDPYPTRTAIELAPEQLERYVGVYRIDEHTTRTVTLVDGQLHTQRSGSSRLPIHPESETLFFYDDDHTYLTFELDDRGQVTGMLLYPGGDPPAERAVLTDEPLPEEPEAAAVDPAIFDGYVGVYELQPGFDIVVAREEDRLVARPTGQPATDLIPLSDTEYRVAVVDARITFVVDASGRATSLVLEQGGQRMEAKRKD